VCILHLKSNPHSFLCFVKNLTTRSANAYRQNPPSIHNHFSNTHVTKKTPTGIINFHTFKFTAFSLFNPCPLRMKRVEHYLEVKEGELKNKCLIQTAQGQRRLPFIGDPGLAATECECPDYRPSLHETVRSGHTYPSNLLHGTPY